MGAPNGEIPERSLTYAQLSAMQEYTQAGVAADSNADMQSVAEEARLNFFNGILGGFFSAVDGAVAAVNQFISDLVLDLKGVTGGFIDLTGFFHTQSADIDTANTGVHTIAAAVTGNITGAVTSTDPNHVGDAVALINETVQTLATPPSLTVLNVTTDIVKDPGAKSYTFDLMAPGAGGGKGPNASGTGGAAGGGGIGGWHTVSILASALPSTFRIKIGPAGVGATSDNTAGTDAGNVAIMSTDETVIYAQATGGKGGRPVPSASTPSTTYNGKNGAGNQTWALIAGYFSGGLGGYRSYNGDAGYDGSNGTSTAGGAGGSSSGGAGGPGESITTSEPGIGGSGGGGGSRASGNGGAGGDGGTPGGGGGGAGGYYALGVNGTRGGNGGAGRVRMQINY